MSIANSRVTVNHNQRYAATAAYLQIQGIDPATADVPTFSDAAMIVLDGDEWLRHASASAWIMFCARWPHVRQSYRLATHATTPEELFRAEVEAAQADHADLLQMQSDLRHGG